MARITPDELWQLVVETRLCDRPTAAALRAEHDAAPGAQAADAKAVAAWLLDRGVLTRWQAKRVGIGDTGPFFYGDYRLLERHDREGEAFEFTARHEPSGRVVTVVLLAKKAWRDPAIRAAIVRRTTIAVAAADPLLVRTWALEEAEGRPFVVCEEVRGETLADELARRGALPLREAGEIALATARAVAELHAAGEVHGGLSLDALVREPAAAGGRLRLRQFPLASDPHEVPPRAQVANEGELVALGRRAAFVAPELATGAACDARSDVYALGCILHALVAGTAPNWRGDARETLERAAADGPGLLDPRVAPPQLAALVDFMTARDPRGRYPDAAEAARALATTFGLPVPSLAAPRPEAAPADFEFALADAPAERDVPAPRPPDPEAMRAAAAEAARRRGRRLRLVGAGLVGAILAGTAALVVVKTTPDRPPRVAPPRPRETPPARPPERSPPPTPPAPADTAKEKEPTETSPRPVPPERPEPTLVDDPSVPWASPTRGGPPELARLPAGSQLVLVARPAAMLADEEGAKFVKALGPGVEAALAAVEVACGCARTEIETLRVGWQTDANDQLIVGWVATLVEGVTLPADVAARSRAWGPAAKAPRPGETIHTGPKVAYWAPAAAAGRVLVAAPAAALAEIVETSAAADPPPLALPGAMEQLVAVLDGSRHLTIVGSPAYLLNSGKGLMAGSLEPLVPEVEALLGESVQAAALSVHCGNDFYVEFDAVAEVGLPPTEFVGQLKQRITGYPAAVKEFRDARELHPYGRALVMELPTMMRCLAANVRASAEGKIAVVNACLPRHAGHNIALAAELALAQAKGGVAAPSGKPPVAAPPPPADALGRLGQKMTLVFAKDTLEKSIQMISEEIGVPMEILGGDLQLEGITKNQSFALEERDKPAEAILRAILAKANPDGKLVYVVRKKEGVETIEITTRAAAEKRGDTLPSAFREAGGTPGRGTK